jgi:hypothetical protein
LIFAKIEKSTLLVFHSQQKTKHSTHSTKKMIVYRDIITEDELLSDAFPLKPVIDSDGNPVSSILLFVLLFCLCEFLFFPVG